MKQYRTLLLIVTFLFIGWTFMIVESCAQVKLTQVESDTVLYRIPVAHRTIPGQPGKYFMKYMGLEPLMDSLDLKGTKIDSMTFASDTLKLYTNDGLFKVEILSGSTGTVTSVGLGLGTSGTDANVSGSPITGSGSFTLNLPSASASNRGLLTSADWTTFNNKIGGGGTLNYVPLWSSGSALTNSVIFQNGSNVGVGTTTTTYNSLPNRLAVNGSIYLNPDLTGPSGIIVRDYTSRLSFWESNTNATRLDIGYLSTGPIWLRQSGQLIMGDYDVSSSVTLAGSSKVFTISGENSGIIVDASGNKRVGFMKYSGLETSFVHANNIPLRFGMVGATSVTGVGTGYTETMRCHTNGNVGIGETSPSRKLDVNGEARIRDLTTTSPNGLVGKDADGVLSAVTLGTGLTITSGTLNQDYGAFTVAATTGGSGLVGPLDGDPFLTFTAGSGMTITRSGTTGDNQTLTFASTGGTTNLSYSTKSGTDVTLESSTGADVIFRDGVGTFVNRVSANVIKYDVDDVYGQLNNTAIIGSATIDGVYRSVDFTVADESYASIIDAKTASDEIEVLVSGTYEIHYSLSYLVPSSRDVRWRIYRNTSDIGYIGELTTYFTAGYPSKTFNIDLTAGDDISLRYIGVNGVSGTIDINSPILKVKRIK